MEGPGQSTPDPHQRVLVVVGPLDDAERAVEALLAQNQGGSLDVVLLELLPPWYSHRVEIVAREQLTRVATRLTSPRVRIVTDVRLGESQADIVTVARQHRVQAIAMPQRSGVLDRLLDASLTSAVTRAAGVPVVVLPGTVPFAIR
jgi:nucleotide-binding universal stress UspA family protein